MAHRLSYRMHYGEIPKGMLVRHMCHKTLCVNPHHLKVGTHLDNMRDMREAGRSTKGERNPMAKLTRAQVDEIRRRYTDGATLKALAEEYDVHLSTIGYAVAGDTWR